MNVRAAYSVNAERLCGSTANPTGIASSGIGSPGSTRHQHTCGTVVSGAWVLGARSDVERVIDGTSERVIDGAIDRVTLTSDGV